MEKANQTAGGTRIVVYALNAPNSWNLKESLNQGGLFDVQCVSLTRQIMEPGAAHLVFMIFDDNFNDYDLEYYQDGKPAWRKDRAKVAVLSDIQAMHEACPRAKICVIDTAPMIFDEMLRAMAEPDETAEAKLDSEHEGVKEFWTDLRKNDLVLPFIVQEELSLHDFPGSLREQVVRIASSMHSA